MSDVAAKGAAAEVTVVENGCAGHVSGSSFASDSFFASGSSFVSGCACPASGYAGANGCDYACADCDFGYACVTYCACGTCSYFCLPSPSQAPSLSLHLSTPVRLLS